jgi:hypothetical protein
MLDNLEHRYCMHLRIGKHKFKIAKKKLQQI